MPVDYDVIRAENQRRYGTDIGRIGRMLLADRYDDRTHFIYELLQNAEDAFARRRNWQGPRSVRFELSRRVLRVSHYGAPFTEEDVRAICGICESAKAGPNSRSIGRFGIGFKSVYAFTDCPEVHSGEEHFVIENYVWPRRVRPIDLEAGETVFILPLRPEEQDPSAYEEIAGALRKLGPRTLLFLREIEEISWSVEGVTSGCYLRGEIPVIGRRVRKVELLGEEEDSDITQETWLVFSREVYTDGGAAAGCVEIAFLLAQDDAGRQRVRPIDDSTLVVFFPTIVPTNLGFLLQGPYNTTPSRDNVLRNDPWNLKLVRETATLLVDALRSLRDMELLDVSALEALPLDRRRFDERCMFAPLFETVRKALSSEPLLPRFGGGYVPAYGAMMARTQGLRELFSPTQLATLFQAECEVSWLSEDITEDRTPELRRYLLKELGIREVTPDFILSKLTKSFLESQSDDWIVQLYRFLNDQPSLLSRLDHVPLVRLEDGSHVPPRINGQPQAYLPGDSETGFPTVRRAVCTSPEAREFLEKRLGLKEPDLVDDVIHNVLPVYRSERVIRSSADYAADINRILKAYKTDSQSQRQKLLSELRDCQFLAARDAGTGETCFAKPSEVYIATDRFKKLFAGVDGVLLVDDSYDCLRGEDVRNLLEACGASRYLQRVPIDGLRSLTAEQLFDLRRQGGCVECTWQDIEDFDLRGLAGLLDAMPKLAREHAIEKAKLLWEALCDLVDRHGTAALLGKLRWQYHRVWSCEFDAAFVRRLNEVNWVPNRDGKLQKPGDVLFEETGWKENPILLSKIRFKPPVLEQLAREAGIEPGVLKLLKEHGITSEEELRARLGIRDEPAQDEQRARGGFAPRAAGAPEGEVAVTPASRLPWGAAAGDDLAAMSQGSGGATNGGSGMPRSSPGGEGPERSAGEAREYSFISYVAVHPEEEGPDADGLGAQECRALEERALQLVIEREPSLRRTQPNNPGFDLFEPGPDGVPVRWIEVKAMTGGLADRPVGLSRVQFEEAQRRGDRYWLYVVEHAGAPDKARILRIRDPAGKARTFTFDRGWIGVAEIEQLAGQSGNVGQ